MHTARSDDLANQVRTRQRAPKGCPMTDLEALDQAHLLHPLVEWRKHEKDGPRIVTGGKGIRLQLEDGSEVIDGLSGLVNINVGHGRTEIRDAVAAQMGKVAYYPAFWNFSTEPAVRLAERLTHLFPKDREIDHFLFTTGGSEANEIAIRIARLYHGVQGLEDRRKIVSRSRAFHGITRAAGSATRLFAYHIFEAPDPLHVESASPYCLRCDLDESYPDCNVACANDIASVIGREGAETVAAVIVEPVLGTGGFIPPPSGYFERLQEICRDTGVLLIVDEVITGFGRTGKWFAMEEFGIHPDIVTFAKGLTSGYLPLGGVGLKRNIYEKIRDLTPDGLPFMGGLTYNNHATSCAAALANIDILEHEGLVENAAQMGAYLLEKLRERFGNEPVAGEIRGAGLACAIEWTKPGGNEPVGGMMEFPEAITKEAWKRGLIVRAFWDSTGIAPPLCVTRDEIDEIVAILGESYEAVKGDFPV
jgi:putrescine aminotransferase